MAENWYDTAQICVNGHLINPMSIGSPAHNKRYCDACGQATITACRNCTSPIRGVFHGSGPVSGSNYSPPEFCHNCGSPFPWKK